MKENKSRRTPTVWYKNSLYMMEDQEMIWLQRKDCASCAVWEWLKADSWKRCSPIVRELSEIENDGISNMLGINTERLNKIVEMMRDDLGWITDDMRIKSWQKWQSVAVKTADADRHYIKYWKDRTKDEGEPEVPAALKHDSFSIAWEEYKKYRANNRWKPLMAMSVERKWRELAEWGLEGAIESINQTIKHGWQGLFKPQSIISKNKDASVWEKTQKLKLVEESMKELKGRFFMGDHTSKWDASEEAQAAKKTYLSLKEKSKALRKEIID